MAPNQSRSTSTADRYAHASIELGEILHDYRLELVLVAGVASGTMERPVQWVHVSELQDPTPFLTPRTVLLTSGARLVQWSTQDEADAYVQRLLDAEVSALGAAVGLHWQRIPQSLVLACDRLGLPLFRVPYGTPFIAISQTAARLLDTRAHERDLWALAAQRAVSGAVLRRDGLASAVRESAAQLGKWVALTDRTGRIVEFAPGSARREVDLDWIRREARALVERGVRAGRVRARAGKEIQLQTLGGAGRLLGVLVTPSAGPPDHAEQTVTGLVVALATMHLDHRGGIADAESSLRDGIIELLLEGELTLAERVSRGVLTRIPRGRVAVTRFAADWSDHTAFADDLRSLSGATPGFILASPDGRDMIVCESRVLGAVRRLFDRHGICAGLSERGELTDLTQLVDQAELAFAHAEAATPREQLVQYTPAIHDGVISLLNDAPGATGRAETMLAPLRAHDTRHNDALEVSLHTWLRHHGQMSPAAAELGIHRHTLRTRVHTAAGLLQADLDSPDTRAELWTAMRLAPYRPGSRTV